MLSKFTKLLHTVSHLKPIQAFYQVKYRFSKVGSLYSFKMDLKTGRNLKFFKLLSVPKCLKVEHDQLRFEFINLSKTFLSTSIDWKDQTHGNLWNYNLQYLDFLKQEEVSVDTKLVIIKDIYSWLWTGKLALAPYPVSLRIMNMIRFLETHQISDEDTILLKSYVLAEVNYLSQNLEYHILANHFLENVFAFWMGANYFNKEDWITSAGRLFKTELEEQILIDGAHYELTPMYHQIILFRVLEAYYLTPNSHFLKNILKVKAELMLGWLDQMTFPNGSVPNLNDTTEGIAMRSNDLKTIGKTIGLIPVINKLKESSYRIMQLGDYRMIVDLAGIMPSYQPGHAHADTFSFVLNHGNSPIIVDPGLSTYNIGERRDWERSTVAHNTLTIDRKNSSEVWAGHRVGKRAKVKLLVDNSDCYSAHHNGYGRQIHKRTFAKIPSGFTITDQVINKKEGQLLEVRFYLHPDVTVSILDHTNVKITENLTLKMDGASTIQLENYDYCLGFNKLIAAKFLLVTFNDDTLITHLLTT